MKFTCLENIVFLGKVDDCFIKVMGKLMNDTFGCVYLDYSSREYNLCSPEKWKEAKQGMRTLVTNASKICDNSCERHDISFGFPYTRDAKTGTSGEKNKSYLFLKLYPTVQIQTTTFSYGFISMIAEIGGYSGLLLGISVLDISKLISINYLNNK